VKTPEQVVEDIVDRWVIDNNYPDARYLRQLREAIASAIRAERERVAELETEVKRLKLALEKINTIRNSIIAFQAINWSEHIYQLVAALNEAGLEGMNYPEALAYFGSMLERTKNAESESRQLKERIAELEEELTMMIEVCDGLSSQQAMDDPWYQSPLAHTAEVLKKGQP
jgi:DNA repair exonuclease SbcCD ATPase subunit